MMLLFLSLHNIGQTAAGLHVFATDEKDAEELGQLYRDLREDILGMARTDIVAQKMAKRNQEKEKK